MVDYKEKIKKLLALSKSPNEHEAQSALAKAQQLMAEHKISMAEVEDKRNIGGLGTVTNRKDCTILRGIGKNVSANRKSTEKEIEGYYSIRCMQKALNICRPVYDTIVREM